MPIVLTHLLSGIIVIGALALVYKKKFSNPIVFVAMAALFTLPDLDHLAFWQPSMVNMILPLTFWDLFTGMFAPRPPLLLHNWLFPAIFALTAIVAYRYHWNKWGFIAILSIAWATHLLLDGVMLM